MFSNKPVALIFGLVLVVSGLWLSLAPRVHAPSNTTPPGTTIPAITSTPADDASAVALPADFQKLIDQANATKSMEPQSSDLVEEAGLKLGDALPELKGEWMSPNGNAPELKDKVLLIDFFTTVCGSCVESIPANNAMVTKYASRGLVFAFVSSEPKALVAEFRAAFPKKIEYPVLTNADGLFTVCNVKVIPATFLFGRNGKLLWKGGLLEKDGKMDAGFEKALNEALNGK
ncbi:MAG: TlpA disulfide reductase family protein [Planctomycetota bacterium]